MTPEEMVRNACHGDSHTQGMIRAAVEQCGIQTIIETGTYHGDSTLWFTSLVPHVFGLEIRTDFLQHSQQKAPKATFILGSSKDLLRQRCDALFANPPVLLYLDAHWQDEWPLRDELTYLNERRRNGEKFVAVIDDAWVPGRPNYQGCHGGGGTVGHRIYGPKTFVDNTPLDYESFAPQLDEWPHFYYPCYPEGGIGHMIASDFPLTLGDDYEVVR